MNLTIDGLTKATANTKKGPAEVWRIRSGATSYSAFCGEWNAGWKVGDRITVEDARIQTVDRDGKTYRNIMAPPKQASAVQDKERVDGLRAIYREILRIEKHLGMALPTAGEEKGKRSDG